MITWLGGLEILTWITSREVENEFVVSQFLPNCSGALGVLVYLEHTTVCVFICNMTEQDRIFVQVGHSLLFCPRSVECCVFRAWKKWIVSGVKGDSMLSLCKVIGELRGKRRNPSISLTLRKPGFLTICLLLISFLCSADGFPYDLLISCRKRCNQ